MYLHGIEKVWSPKFNSSSNVSTNLKRMAKLLQLRTMTTESNFVYQINHKNSLHRLQRIVWYVLRFITHTRRQRKMRKPSKLITATWLSQALITIISQMQRSEFKEEITQHRKYKQIRGTSSIWNLTPFLDDNRLIRDGGWIDNPLLEYDSKHQLLIS